jgi:GNAT superfamily N-acetyltransferase
LVNRSVGFEAVITVSAAQPDDAAAIAGLLEELAVYYRVTETEAPYRDERQVSEMLFGSPPTAYALLARDADGAGRDGGLVVGMAAYSLLWPAAGTTRSLYLKDLYVSEAYRRRGVGKLLMRAVFETAASLGCVRVEWTADPGNPAALAFYDGLGFVSHPKVFYRAESWPAPGT